MLGRLGRRGCKSFPLCVQDLGLRLVVVFSALDCVLVCRYGLLDMTRCWWSTGRVESSGKVAEGESFGTLFKSGGGVEGGVEFAGVDEGVLEVGRHGLLAGGSGVVGAVGAEGVTEALSACD